MPTGAAEPQDVRQEGGHALRPGPRVFTEALLLTRQSDASRRVRAPPTLVGGLYLVVLFALWVLNLADLVLTLHWTGDVGWAAEGNRIMRHVAHLFGPTGFVVYKVLLMTFVVLALWWLYLRFESESAAARRPWQMRTLEAMRLVAVALTVGLVTFYTWVLWNNLHIAGLV